jgi:hypothetical protein
LNWTISGPHDYSGTVELGDAHSIEFVVGGVAAANGYVLRITGVDRFGDDCAGSTAPFNVQSGQISAPTITITCSPPDSGIEQ